MRYKALNEPLQLLQAKAQLLPGETRSTEAPLKKQWANGTTRWSPYYNRMNLGETLFACETGETGCNLQVESFIQSQQNLMKREREGKLRVLCCCLFFLRLFSSCLVFLACLLKVFCAMVRRSLRIAY